VDKPSRWIARYPHPQNEYQDDRFQEERKALVTWERDQTFLISANKRLSWRVEDVGREAGRKRKLVYYFSERMNRVTPLYPCHGPKATRSPSNDMGILGISGCRKTRNTGIKASVKKKFQWTPYSVTCSLVLISNSSSFNRR
jgi:hypothetical protein